MEWIIWVIVIVLIIAIVWWLLNRNSGNAAGTRDASGTGKVASSPLTGSAPDARPTSGATESGPTRRDTTAEGAAGLVAAGGAGGAGGAGMAGATQMGQAQNASPSPEPAPARQESPGAGQTNPEDMEPDIESWDAATPRTAAGTPTSSGGDVDDWEDDEDKAEWDTQWSETGTRPEATPATHLPAAGPAAAPSTPTHHPEYTEPHAPTLPGAESAAAEAWDADAETRQRIDSSAATEAGASHSAEPSGHPEAAGMTTVPVSAELAGADVAGQPYGEGSAASAADGSGPEGYTVKADTASMTYYDEDSSGYDEAHADAWFLSPAHAEAAGFRAPRRTRR